MLKLFLYVQKIVWSKICVHCILNSSNFLQRWCCLICSKHLLESGDCFHQKLDSGLKKRTYSFSIFKIYHMLISMDTLNHLRVYLLFTKLKLISLHASQFKTASDLSVSTTSLSFCFFIGNKRRSIFKVPPFFGYSSLTNIRRTYGTYGPISSLCSGDNVFTIMLRG